MRAEAPSPRLLAANAGIRRQLRIQAVLLTIVGIEAAVFVFRQTWNALS